MENKNCLCFEFEWQDIFETIVTFGLLIFIERTFIQSKGFWFITYPVCAAVAVSLSVLLFSQKTENSTYQSL